MQSALRNSHECVRIEYSHGIKQSGEMRLEMFEGIGLRDNNYHGTWEVKQVLLIFDAGINRQQNIKSLRRSIRKQRPIPQSAPSHVSSRKNFVPRQMLPKAVRHVFIQQHLHFAIA